MIRFLFGVMVGILLFFFFVWFGGGATVRKIGHEVTDTGRRMEVFEEKIKKETDRVGSAVKKFFKEEKGSQKGNPNQ
jgi:hypothetical protein